MTKLSYRQQIHELRFQKGIKFDLISTNDARKFLEESTYYFKATCYLKNFKKNSFNKYDNVDFALVKDISIIDSNLRKNIMEISCNVEHQIKSLILHDMTNDTNNDGYSIVEEFDDFLNNEHVAEGRTYRYKSIIERSLKNIRHSTIEDYEYKLSSKYDPRVHRYHGTPCPSFPVWVLVEKLSYGGLYDFIRFYISKRKYNYTRYEKLEKYMFMTKKLRDAAAHNRPILHNVGNDNICPMLSSISADVENAFNELNLTNNLRQKSDNLRLLKRVYLHDIFCLLLLIDLYCDKDNRKINMKIFKKFIRRVDLNQELYKNKTDMKNVFNFIKQIYFTMNTHSYIERNS